MRSNKAITSKAVILAGLFFLCLFTASIAFAYDYQVTEIQPLPGYTASRAMGINNLGEVVGRFYNIDPATGEAVNRKAFVWDSANGAYLLRTLSGESSAWDINDNGFATGYSYNAAGKQRAVLWDLEAWTIDDIGALRNPTTGAYGESSTAYGINNLDQVVGSADIPNNTNTFAPFHAFLDDTSGISDLGTLNTSMSEWQYGYSIAYCVNNNGQVVGIAQDTPWAAFIYDDESGMRQLPKDPAYSDKEWYAVVINDSGIIGGHVIAADNRSLPYYWPNASSNPVKITMPAGFPYGEIYGINASGQMVGIMWSSDQTGATEHAFIFDIQNGVRDLNSLIDPASGWALHFARDINSKGQVVGYGELNGEERGFLINLQLRKERRLGDFNGDGKADIFWRNLIAGQNCFWLMNGTSKLLDGSPGRVSDPDWQVVGIRDFDGDGKDDVLWRKLSTGQIGVWVIDGTNKLEDGTVGKVFDFAWAISGLGDFNGDKKTDILWRNISTGLTYVWLMNGTSKLLDGSPGRVSDPNWQVVGVRDFDGDGKDDVLWHNQSTGRISVWLMDGADKLLDGSPAVVSDLAWEIMGLGDFNGDKKADIFWRHKATGLTYVWLMNGVSKLLDGSPGRVADLNWQVVGISDFDGDGKSDVLWRQLSTGQICVWLIDGIAKLKDGTVGKVSDSAWVISGLGDFNGDKKTDIFWWNRDTGLTYVWLMNGTKKASDGTPGRVSQLSWELQ